jgi:hypothetical protein
LPNLVAQFGKLVLAPASTTATAGPEGACCFPDGSCLDSQTEANCLAAGGIAWLEDEINCGVVGCNVCPNEERFGLCVGSMTLTINGLVSRCISEDLADFCDFNVPTNFSEILIANPIDQTFRLFPKSVQCAPCIIIGDSSVCIEGSLGCTPENGWQFDFALRVRGTCAPQACENATIHCQSFISYVFPSGNDVICPPPGTYVHVPGSDVLMDQFPPTIDIS